MSIYTNIQDPLSDRTVKVTTDNALLVAVVPAQKFWIPASSTYDIYITDILIWMIDDSVKMKDFGDITNGITNGVDCYIIQNGQTNYAMQNVTNNVGFIQYSGGSFEVLAAVVGNDYGFIVPIEFPIPLRLGVGTLDRFEVLIKDNITSLIEFTIFANGYKQG
jgi:hypothetical protein